MVSSTPQPHFTPGKDLVPILQEDGWDLYLYILLYIVNKYVKFIKKYLRSTGFSNYDAGNMLVFFSHYAAS